MGYTLITNTAARSSTNAEFQAWGSQISNVIANCGFVLASNVGTMIDWATVARPPSTSTSMGYEIWQFNDALQNTAPIYFKMEYGSGAFGNGEHVGVWLTLGSGANSSGNVTGNTSPRVFVQSTLTVSTIQQSFYSGDVNRLSLGFCGNPLNIQYTWLLGFERSKDENGNDTGDGAYLMSYSYLGFQECYWTPSTGNVAASSSYWGILTPQALAANGQYYDQNPVSYLVPAFPVFFFGIGGKALPPATVFAAYRGLPTPTTIPVRIYDRDVTYMTLPAIPSNLSRRNSTGYSFIMRWD